MSKYFVTGALGCIGAWVVKTLLERGDQATVFDLAGDPRRIRDLVDDDGIACIDFVEGDLTDFDSVSRAIGESGATKIIHLAGLQVPFCKADPPKGARVNVLGTLHVFEAAKAHGCERVVYASSAAVYGPPEGEAPDESAATEPTTQYGVFKRANEGSARVYWQDDGLASVGLRPLTVYGVGRDQGITSGPTSAMKAVVLGKPFTISFGGSTDFHYVADTAACFVECADRAPAGAKVYNLHGQTHALSDVARTIEEVAGVSGLVQVDGPELPIPPRLDGRAIHEDIPGLPKTELANGVRETLDRFRALQAAGRLDTRDL